MSPHPHSLTLDPTCQRGLDRFRGGGIPGTPPKGQFLPLPTILGRFETFHKKNVQNGISGQNSACKVGFLKMDQFGHATLWGGAGRGPDSLPALMSNLDPWGVSTDQLPGLQFFKGVLADFWVILCGWVGHQTNTGGWVWTPGKSLRSPREPMGTLRPVSNPVKLVPVAELSVVCSPVRRRRAAHPGRRSEAWLRTQFWWAAARRAGVSAATGPDNLVSASTPYSQ